VSVKLTPEICINKASSNSRLTAAGRQATASDSHSQAFDETTTELHLHAEKLTEIVLHLVLGHIVVFFVLFGFFPFVEIELLLRHNLQDRRLWD
jgi:Fe2+ transport system protein B